jgi:RNA polymerase sigma factor (sigma-70 family)
MSRQKITRDKKIEIFENEFLPHIEALKTFAFYLTYDEDDTNDLVQDTYLKAFKFADKYDKGTNSKAWLFKILKNAYINEYRKKSRQPDRVDIEEVINYHANDEPEESKYFDLKEEIFDSIMGDEVTQAINSLPPEFRTVILLADIEEFSYKEMALILDVPLGTVRSRLFRARNTLKELLKNYAVNLGYKDLRGKTSEEE